MTPLVVVAAGGLAREAVEAVRAAGSHTVVAVLDDDPARHGSEVMGVTVVGGAAAVDDYPDAGVLLCAGRGAVRETLAGRLAALGVGDERWATVVHPGAHVAPSCSVGPGSVVLAGAVLTADVAVGRHVVAMPQVVLTHDVVVEDFVTLAAGVLLAGRVRVGRRAYFGMGATVRENVRVGRDCVVGMGAALLTDLADGEVCAGVPARPLERTGRGDGRPS